MRKFAEQQLKFLVRYHRLESMLLFSHRMHIHAMLSMQQFVHFLVQYLPKTKRDRKIKNHESLKNLYNKEFMNGKKQSNSMEIKSHLIHITQANEVMLLNKEFGFKILFIF